jgi:hypothetical protein
MVLKTTKQGCKSATARYWEGNVISISVDGWHKEYQGEHLPVKNTKKQAMPAIRAYLWTSHVL